MGLGEIIKDTATSVINTGVRAYSIAQAITHPLKYLKGQDMFYHNDKNVAIARVNFMGGQYSNIRPNTTGYVGKGVRREGEIKQDLQVLKSDIPFNINGIGGKLSVQTNYEIIDPMKFYWQVGNDPTKIKEVIDGHILKSISKADNPNDLGTMVEKVSDLLQPGGDITHIAQKIYQDYGIQVKEVSAYAIDYDPRSQGILSQVAEANAEHESRSKYWQIESEGVKSRSETADKWLKEAGLNKESPIFPILKTIIMSEINSEQMQFQRSQNTKTGGSYSEAESNGIGAVMKYALPALILSQGGGLENILKTFVTPEQE